MTRNLLGSRITKSICNIVTDIGSTIRLFADDTCLFIIVDNPLTAADCLNSDLSKIARGATTWLVSFNPTKLNPFSFRVN